MVQGFLQQPGSDCEGENQRRAKEGKLKPPPISRGNYPGVLSSVWGFLPPRGSSGQSRHWDHPEHGENAIFVQVSASLGQVLENSSCCMLPLDTEG